MLFMALVIFGLFAIKSMSVNLFPEIEIPLVKITTHANGNKEFINSKITKKLEDEISGISGIKNLNSYSYNGLSVILVEFNLDKNIEIALNDVRDKISKANLAFKSVTEKISAANEPIFSVFISRIDENKTALMQDIDNVIRNHLERVNGVLGVDEVGFLKPVVDVKFDSFLLNKFDLNTAEISNIIATQNLKTPLGKIKSDESQTPIVSDFDAKNLDELRQIRLKNGVFLKDVASVDFAGLDSDTLAIFGGKSGVLLEVKKQSFANTLEVIKRLKISLENLAKILDKNYQISVVYDKSELVLKHVKQASFDMILGIFLTALIVFLFLRNLSATIIATIAVPISIIGTFFIINLLGFDINRLTLVALTLGIGVFIDDAIVVIENVTKKLDTQNNALMASFLGVKEIAFSVLAISAVLLCVFVPIAFMQGIVGRYFYSFALSVAGGVVVSFFVCIMLTPTLLARFLTTKKGKFFVLSEPFFAKLDSFYERILELVLRFKKSFLLISFLIFAFCLSLTLKVGGDFMPSEDNSEFNIFFKADPNISVSKMSERLEPILAKINADKRVKKAFLLIGYDDAKSAYKAKIYVHLKSLNERSDRQKIIMSEYRNTLKFSDLNVSVASLPVVDVGDNEPFSLIIKGDDFAKLDEIYAKIRQDLMKFGGVVDIKSPNEDRIYEISLSLNRQKTKLLGIDEKALADTINSSFSQVLVSIFDDGANQYDIAVSLDKKESINRLKNLKVKNNKGESFMLSDFATFTKKREILLIPRHNRQNQLKILANLDNRPLGDVASFISQNLELPSGYSYQFSGQVELMHDTNRAFVFTILLSAVLIYMILAALYESFILPFVIMLSLPLAFAGVGLGLFLSSNSFSLFVMVGAILLFGMVGKNAILLLDFANKFAKEGLSPDLAVKKAGAKRLHAILMTTFAMIFAMLPLALSRGSGYEANSPMATAIIFGLISSTILTLLVVPALFSTAYRLDSWFRKFYEREAI